MNRSDCFVLDCGRGKSILVYMPPGSRKMEKFRAIQVSSDHILLRPKTATLWYILLLQRKGKCNKIKVDKAFCFIVRIGSPPCYCRNSITIRGKTVKNKSDEAR